MSLLPETIYLLSEDMSTESTLLECPLKVLISLPVFKFQSLTQPLPPETIYLLSKDMSTELT